MILINHRKFAGTSNSLVHAIKFQDEYGGEIILQKFSFKIRLDGYIFQFKRSKKQVNLFWYSGRTVRTRDKKSTISRL